MKYTDIIGLILLTLVFFGAMALSCAADDENDDTDEHDDSGLPTVWEVPEHPVPDHEVIIKSENPNVEITGYCKNNNDDLAVTVHHGNFSNKYNPTAIIYLDNVNHFVGGNYNSDTDTSVFHINTGNLHCGYHTIMIYDSENGKDPLCTAHIKVAA